MKGAAIFGAGVVVGVAAVAGATVTVVALIVWDARHGRKVIP